MSNTLAHYTKVQTVTPKSLITLKTKFPRFKGTILVYQNLHQIPNNYLKITSPTLAYYGELYITLLKDFEASNTLA